MRTIDPTEVRQLINKGKYWCKNTLYAYLTKVKYRKRNDLKRYDIVKYILKSLISEFIQDPESEKTIDLAVKLKSLI